MRLAECVLPMGWSIGSSLSKNRTQSSDLLAKNDKKWNFINFSHFLLLSYEILPHVCLTHHPVGPQKWSSYWQKLETICKKLTVLVYRSKWAQFHVKCNLVKMRFQNLCFGAKIKIFDFFYFLARNGSQMVKNHLVNIELTIWTHFWPNLSIFQIFSFSITFIGNLAACLKV